MTIDPAILDAMLAAGASAEVIVAAVKADAANGEARRAAQRAGNARRQRRYRDRLHGEETGDLFAGDAAPAGQGERDRDRSIPAARPAPLPDTVEPAATPDDGGDALRGGDDAARGVTGVIPPSLDKSPQTPKINPNPRAHTGDAPAREPACEAAPGAAPGNIPGTAPEIPPDTARPPAAARFPCPAGCDPADWRDLLANRRAKRLAMTAAGYRKLLRDLAAFADEAWPPGRLLAHAAERGWAQIFDPRDSDPRGDRRHADRPHRNNRRSHGRSDARTKGGVDPGAHHNPIVRAVLRSEAGDAGGAGPGF